MFSTSYKETIKPQEGVTYQKYNVNKKQNGG
jgi:hypothetical protein